MLFVQRLLKENSWKYLLFFTAFLILGVILQFDFQIKTGEQCGLTVQNLYVLLWYGGEPIKVYSERAVAQVPGMWFWTHSILYVLMLRCIDRNAEHTYVWILSQGSRSRIWNQIVYRVVINGIIYMVLLWLALSLAAMFRGGKAELSEEAGVIESLEGVYRHLSISTHEDGLMFWIYVFIMPMLVCMAIHMLQEVLAILNGAIISVVISFGYLFVSNFIYHWGLIGNASMLARSELLGYPADWWKSALVCIGICITCYIVGYIRIEKEDIMERI